MSSTSQFPQSALPESAPGSSFTILNFATDPRIAKLLDGKRKAMAAHQAQAIFEQANKQPLEMEDEIEPDEDERASTRGTMWLDNQVHGIRPVQDENGDWYD